MNSTILQINDLSIIYKTDIETVYAVNNINLSIDRGKTLGIVGETGAGKTTTALSILKLLPEKVGVVTNGEILFNNENLVNKSFEEMMAIRGEKISMIFQDPMTSLNPVITIGDQIYEVLQLHNHNKNSKKELNKKVDEILQMVGIPHNRKNEYPHQFSGGMKQRVVIAIALACEPDLLIADEPTTALDVTIQAQVLDMIDKLKEKLNTSMLLITHDLGIVVQVCDSVAIMYAGEILENGPVEAIFDGDKHHPYTEGLFGSIPKINDKTERLNPIAGLMPDPTVLPKGCSFYPRCPKRMDICQYEKPGVYDNKGHLIKCHLYNKF